MKSLIDNPPLTYTHQDLVLQVDDDNVVSKYRLDLWDDYLNELCEDRNYQKIAIKTALTFLLSEKYSTTFDLAKENYDNSSRLHARFLGINEYKFNPQFLNKKSANIDLATGTGKSYVIYGITQIMLGLNIVDKVLILCPNTTIEQGLKGKFEVLSSNAKLKRLIPSEILGYKNPSILDGNQTITYGGCCIENIHSVYENTGSSIEDSFKGLGTRTLVLNDESHHIYNNTPTKLKKWKEFLTNDKYDFKYILGFTGTAYINKEYFNDVIFRYSIKEADYEQYIKKIYYAKGENSKNNNTRFHKICENHKNNIEEYSKVKPLTIFVNNNIDEAKKFKNDFIKFLKRTKIFSKKYNEKSVLIVTSDKDHKNNLKTLEAVDDIDNPVEWIISVSMLTEGWDVKNVFQIVPLEERVFNSKLLIAQVLGRGLRIPYEYTNNQPTVTVFNHFNWEDEIDKLLDEILDIRTRITSSLVSNNNSRFNHNIKLMNMPLKYIEKEVIIDDKDNIFDYSNMKKHGIKLDPQNEVEYEILDYQSFTNYQIKTKQYEIVEELKHVNVIIDQLFDDFKSRDIENVILKYDDLEYYENKLPPRDEIFRIIKLSMRKARIKSDYLNKENELHVLNAFKTMLRNKNSYLSYDKKFGDIFIKDVRKDLARETVGIANFSRNYKLYYTNDWKNDLKGLPDLEVLSNLIDKYKLSNKSIFEIDSKLFKTPANVVILNGNPERDFVRKLCSKPVAECIDCWVKSRDIGFYEIEYSMKLGADSESRNREYTQKLFNPDFFIKITKNKIEYILVVEIKMDDDINDENIAKYKQATKHFRELNKRLRNSKKFKQRYIFNFLSRKDYKKYFNLLISGELINKFNSDNPYKSRLDLDLN